MLKDHMLNRRNQDWANINEAEALELIKQAQASGGRNPFASNLPKEEKLSDEEIDRRAFFDLYTPTYNFRYMLRSFRRELTRAKRYKRPLSLCVVIVDGLVDVLANQGHLALESSLLSSAETLIRCCRSDVDMVGRYGEDRYMLILPETPGTGAAVLAERIRKKFTALEIAHQWHKLKLTSSIGIAYYPGHGGDVEELIAQADLAAETVQERGGNGICYAPENPDTVA